MENVNFELYKVFYYVAKYQNLTKAAKELFISQPAITQSIKKLEEQIGYTLFYRTKHGMNLTTEGEVLLEYLQTSIERLLSARKKLEDSSKDENICIRLGGGVTVLEHNLLEPLKLFKTRHEKIEFIIKQDTSNHLLEMLLDDQLDIVLLTGNFSYKEEIEFIPIEEIHDRFIASTKEFQHYKDHIFSMKELNDLPLILQENTSSTRQYMNQLAANENTILSSTYELTSYELILDFIRSGLGIGFINRNRIKTELHSGKVFELKTTFSIPPRYIYVALHKKNRMNKILREFIDCLKKS